MRDVRERPAVHERRLPLERLHEVRLDRLLEQDGHRARGLQLLGGHRLALVGVADVIAPSRRRRSCRSDATAAIAITSDAAVMSKPGLPRVAVRLAAEPDRDVAQRAVVDVDAAAPADRQRVDAELVAVQEVRLEHRGEQVVRGADRVDVAGEVEVHVLHRHDLRVAAAGGAALDPEHGAERRLAQAERRRCLPMWPRPCVSETEVVVLPSPAFVGVIAVTSISFPSGCRASRSSTPRSIFAL